MIPFELQQEGAAAMDLVFDFFKRTSKVRFYKSPSEVVISSDPNWNADFQNPYVNNIVKTAQYADFECRIWFPKDAAAIKKIDGEENLDIAAYSPKEIIRIQMRKEAYDWLGDVKSFWIEGEKFSISSDIRKLGIFSDFQFYEIQLQKNN